MLMQPSSFRLFSCERQRKGHPYTGELTAVCVPNDEDEALRDLTRAREDAKIDEKKAKQRLLAFLLRSGYRYSGRAPWSQAHMRWLSDLKMPHRC
jgi:transposase